MTGWGLGALNLGQNKSKKFLFWVSRVFGFRFSLVPFSISVFGLGLGNWGLLFKFWENGVGLRGRKFGVPG